VISSTKPYDSPPQKLISDTSRSASIPSVALYKPQLYCHEDPNRCAVISNLPTARSFEDLLTCLKASTHSLVGCIWMSAVRDSAHPLHDSMAQAPSFMVMKVRVGPNDGRVLGVDDVLHVSTTGEAVLAEAGEAHTMADKTVVPVCHG
jgi:hypothetical protein